VVLRSGLLAAALAALALCIQGCGGAAHPRAATPGGKVSRLTGFVITEYWPVPEGWFKGKLVSAPGLPGKHRVDWLYSGTGMAVEGDGVGLDGRRYSVKEFGVQRFVNAAGKPTKPTRSGVWTHGDPAWRQGGWRAANGAVTFPLEAGGWAHGPAATTTPEARILFGTGPSLPLQYMHSIATDPRVIPKGTRVYIPAYHHWFVAQDTGNGIIGRHIDVFRSPPKTADGGRFLKNQTVLISGRR
jgi:hypothetical protein